MITKTINLYSFKELSKEAKQHAIDEWYEVEDYPCLAEDLAESCKELLKEAKIEHDGLKLFYSLSYSQGDGLCFIGTFTKAGITMNITHNYRYYFADSVTFNFTDKNGEDASGKKRAETLKSIYFNICKELEREGYGILEYRMDFAEMEDLCDANDYYFTIDGKLTSK